LKGKRKAKKKKKKKKGKKEKTKKNGNLYLSYLVQSYRKYDSAKGSEK